MLGLWSVAKVIYWAFVQSPSNPSQLPARAESGFMIGKIDMSWLLEEASLTHTWSETP